MLNRIFVVDSVTLSSTGTAVSSYVPWDQTTRKLPTQVVVKATGQGAYVRLSNDASAATNVDVLVQGGDHVVLSVQGRRWVSVLSDGASSTVSVGALSTGVSGSAASLDLAFAGAATLDPLVTFTRASTATFFNSAGVLQSASNNVPRFDYNPSTLAAQGLLIEEARTNIQLQSEDLSSATGWGTTGSSISTNATTAPTGAVTADKLVEDTSTGLHLVASTNAVTAGVAYTFTVFAKAAERTQFQISGMGLTGAGFNIVVTLTGAGSVSGAPVGTAITLLNNGWYRVSVPFTPTNTTPPVYSLYNGTTNSYTGNGTSGLFLWGAQTEAGAFPTSYIPTTTTALTRAADVASVNTLSPWFNSVEGTFYSEGVFLGSQPAGAFGAVWSLNNFPNEALMTYNPTNQVGLFVRDAGVTQANLTSTYVVGTTYKTAATLKVNDFAQSINGGSVATDTSGSIPTISGGLVIGGSVAGSTKGAQYIRRITYYPRRLSNAELQAITA